MTESKGVSDDRIVSIMSWLEDCTNLYVQIIRNPAGIGFPDNEVPETRIYAVQEIVQVGDLNNIMHKCIQENIWRSWQLFSDALCSDFVSYVPIYIDIDNEERNLEAAYTLTRDCLGLLENMSQFRHPDQIRVVFSGKKGFHIEAKPVEPLNNLLVREDLLRGLNEMGQETNGITNYFANGVIDLNHDFIRLTGSFNSWNEDGIFTKRKVFQMSPEDFRKTRVQNILDWAKVD